MIPFPRLLWDRRELTLASPAPRSPWVRRSWEALFLLLALTFQLLSVGIARPWESGSPRLWA